MRTDPHGLVRNEPTLVLITAPFPGNVYGAFRVAQTIKQAKPRPL